MFYSLNTPPPFDHDPAKAFIAPRPIAWVGTRSQAGDNLAAFSFFMLISTNPFFIAFSVSPDLRDGHEKKDTLTNIEDTKIFSLSIPSQKHCAQVAASGANAPLGVDEFALFNIPKAECQLINAPFVGDAVASVECALERVETIGAAHLVIGRGLGVHLDENMMEGERFNSQKAKLLSRLGYFDYSVAETIIEQPTQPYKD